MPRFSRSPDFNTGETRDITPPPRPSFNGSLKQYSYDATPTSTRSARSGEALSPSSSSLASTPQHSANLSGRSNSSASPTFTTTSQRRRWHRRQRRISDDRNHGTSRTRRARPVPEPQQAGHNSSPNSSEESSSSSSEEPLQAATPTAATAAAAVTTQPPFLPNPAPSYSPGLGDQPGPPPAQLPGIPDALAPNLIAIFVGNNPGLKTSQVGHSYAHKNNVFWKVIHLSGCTPYQCRPQEDLTLPARFGLGQTNIVPRPTRSASDVGTAEMTEGALVLEDKIRQYKPEVVCLVGKGIWAAICKAKTAEMKRRGQRPMAGELRGGTLGWQTERLGAEPGWEGAKVFAGTSTSGLDTSMDLAAKINVWRPLGEYIQRRRRERGEWLVDGHAV